MTTTKKPEARELDPKRGTFDVRELAWFLGVSRSTIWRMHRTGKLPKPIRFNRSVRWDRWTIEEWLSSGAPTRLEWENLQRINASA